MGDFLLDMRDVETRRRSGVRAAELLKFTEDTRALPVERPGFSLLLSRVDGFELWGPYEGETPTERIWVGLAGRVALSAAQWEAGRQLPGPGGLACKAIFALYRSGGLEALRSLSGNFVVFLHEEATAKLQWFSDPCGMYLCYAREPLSEAPVVGSHPDVLAAVTGEGQEWNKDSMAEFVMTGRLSFPHTYYRRIQALQTGCVHACTLSGGRMELLPKTPLFQFQFQLDPNVSEWSLAEELAERLKDSVQRRTLPLLGATGLGLSGGLDSRTLLAAMDAARSKRTFFLLDEENAEYKVARWIAEATGVDLVPLKRPFDYYGSSAERGVRISGGTGNIASNHYLGIWPQLKGLGIENLVTGCYCDYVFKGLALNRVERRLQRDERIGAFGFQFYRPIYGMAPAYDRAVRARLREGFPEAGKTTLSEEDWLAIEARRTFPMAYESDLAQRVIPQRVMAWSPPLVDTGLLELYQRIPSRFKLNASLFKKAMSILCPPALCAIPDNGTGAAVSASGWSLVFHKYRTALVNRIASRVRPGIASRGSWPNWEFYVGHSQVVESTWARPNATARALLTEILGRDPWEKSPSEYRGRDLELFLRLWTLKLWLDQRG